MTQCNSIRNTGQYVFPHTHHSCGEPKNHPGRCKCENPKCKKTWTRTVIKRTGTKLYPMDKKAVFVKSTSKANE